MSLQEKLEEVTRAVVQRRGQSQAEKLFAGQIETARSWGVEGKALSKGDRAPEFTLPDQHGTPIALSALLESGPAIIVFYRGSWCPYCNMQLRALNASLPEIEKLGGRLVAISPELPDFASLPEGQQELDFLVLSDRGNQVARAFGLVFTVSEHTDELLREANMQLEIRNGESGRELPVPATLVIGPDQHISASFLDIDYRKRPEPVSIVAALRDCVDRVASG